MARRDDRSFTPTGVDPTRLGEADTPESAILGEEWGEPEKGAVHGANHTRRGAVVPEARFQGAKTRAAAKDQISRRS